MKTKRKIIFLAALLLAAASLLGGQNAKAAPCSGTCYPVVCPEGTSSSSGSCSNTSHVCCSGNASNYKGTASGGSSFALDFSEKIQTVKTLEEAMSSMSGYLNAVAGTIAIIFIIIGASFYIVAAFGHKKMTELGKKIMIYAIGGFAVVVGAPVIYKEIMNIMEGDPSGVAEASSMAKILLGALRGFAYLIGLYAILGFLIGGIAYFISFGDEKRNERAKTILKFTLIGSLIAIGAMVIAKQIVTLIDA